MDAVSSAPLLAFWTFYGVFMLCFYVMMAGFSIVSYVLMGKSLSAIARRRGIEKPWLAWVPVGTDWLMGCISDQYRYVVHHQETNRRRKLLGLNIALLSSTVLLCVLTVVLVAMAIAAESSGAISEEAILMLCMLILLMCYGVIALAVVYSVLCYKVYFDIFRSCDPGSSVIFLVLSILLGVPTPFFFYSLRNKDLGMPPRQEPVELPEAE